MLSDVAKYGTWKDIRLLNMPQGKAVDLRGVSTHVENHTADIWSLACVFSELLIFMVAGTTPSRNATQSRSLPHRAAKRMIMRRGPPLDRFNHQSVQFLSRMQSATLSNTPISVYWSPASVCRPSESTISTTTNFLLLTDTLRLVLPKLHSNRGKVALSLHFVYSQDLGVSIAIHATKEECYVSLQPTEAQKSVSNLRMANAGAIVDLLEAGVSNKCMCRSAASWRAWVQVCQSVLYLLECKMLIFF